MTEKKNATKRKRKSNAGRPTKYTDEMPQRLMDFFNVPQERIVEKEVATATGVKVIRETVANKLPTVHGFCASIPIAMSTFQDWVAANPEFRATLAKCKQMQTDHLMQKALDGGFHAGFAKFMMMNLTKYREKVEQKQDTEIKVTIQDDDQDL
jgi:hypothetical protein